MFFHCPSLRKIIPATLLGCLALLPVRSPGQVPDGQRGKDKPGLALVKPQPWSNEDQATVLEFLGYSDHSGYCEFRTAKIPSLQVASAKIVKLVVYPESVQSLTSAGQRAALQKTLDDFAALSAKFPSAARHLEGAAATLKADAAKYDAGNVKDGGQWVLRSAYYRQKATVLANLLRPELEAAPKIKDVDLTTNQYYLGLQDLANAEPSVGTVLVSIRALYQSLVRRSDRTVLLNQLNSPTLGYEAAVDLVKQLKALNPDEDARANIFVQSWDTAVAKAGQLTKQINDAQSQFEGSMPAADDSGKLPEISPEIASKLDNLGDAVKAFRTASPPAAIHVPLQLADAMISCGEKFPVLAKQIESHEILDAKSVLDPLSNQAGVIGPKVSKILAAVQKKLAGDIEKFQTLRNEAKMLAENDKIEEALKKYQLAFAIIPAKDVAAQIEILKKQ